ncbi:MAG: tetratricopeptide repeat protein [Thermodesulfobacteriota bacterium]
MLCAKFPANSVTKHWTCSEKPLAICRNLNDRVSEGPSLNNLGNVYCGGGQYYKAMEHYEESLEISRKIRT